MKPIDLLLLDFNSHGSLGNELCSILEASRLPEIQLHHESIENVPLSDRSNYLANLFNRLKPSVTFLVSQINPLKSARTLFQSLKTNVIEPSVIVVTEEDEPDEVFETLKLGAVDFITAPLTPINIVPRVRRLLSWDDLSLSETFSTQHKLVGHSPAFLSEINKIPMVAKCDAGVMISGETGTGKELCARAIHNLSTRSGQPFIPVNCGAIPVELAENELFGHERGAFTGAGTAQPGLIQEADKGTLFLDEIDSLPLLAQVKLLRFLQEREFRPLGSTKTRHADVRVVTATNVNFERAIKEGKLRQDLYYRLNIIPITLPPLRERLEDIQLLAEFFRVKYSLNFNKHVTGFSPNALQNLLMHDWPGNVRELEHVVQRAVAMCQLSLIRTEDIQLTNFSASPVVESFKNAKDRVVNQFERNYLQSLLLVYQGNITRAAEAAQKDRRAFWELMRKHQIDSHHLSYHGTV
jgi:two-component system, NtrC family, response regulator GlrR